MNENIRDAYEFLNEDRLSNQNYGTGNKSVLLLYLPLLNAPKL